MITSEAIKGIVGANSPLILFIISSISQEHQNFLPPYLIAVPVVAGPWTSFKGDDHHFRAEEMVITGIIPWAGPQISTPQRSHTQCQHSLSSHYHCRYGWRTQISLFLPLDGGQSGVSGFACQIWAISIMTLS